MRPIGPTPSGFKLLLRLGSAQQGRDNSTMTLSESNAIGPCPGVRESHRAVVFGLLVIATFAAFIVTERRKRSPLAVRQRTLSTVLLPRANGSLPRASIRIELSRPDLVSVFIVSSTGAIVRHIARDRPEPAHYPLQYWWDGRSDSRSVVPGGHYDVRVGLRKQGRAITLRYGIQVRRPS